MAKQNSGLASIQLPDSSVHLSNRIKLLGVTLDLNFDSHISNAGSAGYFHVKALRRCIRPCNDLATAKCIASSIVGSRLYANAALSWFSKSKYSSASARVVLAGRTYQFTDAPFITHGWDFDFQ